MISITDLHVSFGSTRVLRGVTLQVAEGEIVGLIGPSGGGKSVLLKSIAAVIDPNVVTQSGTVTLTGVSNLMFQEGALFDSMTVFDNIAFPLVGGRVPSANLPEEERERVRVAVTEILRRVGLLRAAWKYPAQLSGGMRRRVSLARALVAKPQIALLDDPTAGLDPVASSVIMALIRELHSETKPTTIIVSHDLRRLLPMVDSIAALAHGTVDFRGNLSELSQQPKGDLRHFVECRFEFGSVPTDPNVRYPAERTGVVSHQ
jgi:phospholipid/cholesterol/gamma-HCH transport system ATP-binding protein